MATRKRSDMTNKYLKRACENRLLSREGSRRTCFLDKEGFREELPETYELYKELCRIERDEIGTRQAFIMVMEN